MKNIIIGLALATCLIGCDSAQPSFSINESDTSNKYAHNKYFKEVDHRAYRYYFKGSPTLYYGIPLKDKDIFSGYITFMGPNPPLCFSKLNFKGRKTFNSLLKDLKEKQFIANDAVANESFGVISYRTDFSTNQHTAIYIHYNSDFGFGYLTAQSPGCMKAMFN